MICLTRRQSRSNSHRQTSEHDHPDALQCAEIIVQIAVYNNQVGIEPILQQTFPVPESTDSGRCGCGCY